MKFDDILGHLGHSGLYQKIMVFIISLSEIPAAIQLLAQVFFAADVDFWCSSSDSLDTACSPAWNLTTDQCEQATQNFLSLTKDDNCNEYINLTFRSFVNDEEPNGGWLVRPCTHWTYDTSQYRSTIIQEWDLVCDKSTKPAIAQSVFFAGVLVGSIVLGALSDRIGRKTTFCIGVAVVGVSGLAVSFSPSYVAYTSLRFIVAVANVGIFMQSSIIATEWVGPSQRKVTVLVLATMWSVGYMLLSLFAYLLPRWRTLAIVNAVSVFILLFLIPFIPESPRWLIMQGRIKEANKTIQTAARVNKVTLPEDLFDEEQFLKDKSTRAQGTMLDLFRTKKMRRKTIIQMYIWFVDSCVYYGLSLSTSGLGVNAYVAFMVSGAVEIPANLLLFLTVDRVGRRPCLFVSMLTGGIACILSIFMPGTWRIMTAMIGKFSITFAFTLAYLFSKEIFPTPVRSTGLGITSTSARVGGILSPFILLIKDVWEPLPYIIFGSLAISAGFLGLLLPETTGKKLPETLEDGDLIDKKISMNLEVDSDPKDADEALQSTNCEIKKS